MDKLENEQRRIKLKRRPNNFLEETKTNSRRSLWVKQTEKILKWVNPRKYDGFCMS